MTFNEKKYHRRSIRLKGYDYSQAGAYFITICTQNRECMFGEIADGKMVLNPAGEMIQTVWDEIPFHYAGIDIDEFMAMPNHIHGIVVIVGATPRGYPGPIPCGFTTRAGTGACPGATAGTCPYVRDIVIAGRGASIQNHDHQTIRRWGETIGLAIILRKIVAAQLLGAYCTQRDGIERNSGIHSD